MDYFLLRCQHDGAIRWALQTQDETRLLPDSFQFSQWLAGSTEDVQAHIDTLTQSAAEAIPTPEALLAPVDAQEIWASGVTYLRSRDARQEEAQDGGDVYARVYHAQRPELFFKSLAYKAVGQGDAVGIRQDATWNVPEPELALVLNPAMQVIGFTIGNDMSSRDIEGENPLYLPQAKVYDKSCALGPRIWLNPANVWPDVTIAITISRSDEAVFQAETNTGQIKRTLPELASYLGRSHTLDYGALLLTGTGVVPPSDFTLQAGDVVSITIEPIGTLTNTVTVV